VLSPASPPRIISPRASKSPIYPSRIILNLITFLGLAWKGKYIVTGDSVGNLNYFNFTKNKFQTFSTDRGVVRRIQFEPSNAETYRVWGRKEKGRIGEGRDGEGGQREEEGGRTRTCQVKEGGGMRVDEGEGREQGQRRRKGGRMEGERRDKGGRRGEKGGRRREEKGRRKEGD
jgi:hypothetical protein